MNQVNIHLFIESMPFGGVGPAGMGHYYGRYGFEALTHAKSMLIAPDGVAIDHLIPPYDRSTDPRSRLFRCGSIILLIDKLKVGSGPSLS